LTTLWLKGNVLWVVIIGLAFVAGDLSLASVPNAAIHYWHLNFSRLILASTG